MATFKKILFPTDFSTNADRALAHAVRLADIDGGEVIVQHVVATYFERHPHWATLFDVHELQKYMEGYADFHLKKVLPKGSANVHMKTVVSKGPVAEEIAALAQREMVDLVVMGSAKAVNTNKVIRMTSRPVLAVSAKRPSLDDTGLDGMQKVSKILIATDFSTHSERVVRYAFELKRMFDCRIYMLYVIEAKRAIDWALRQGHFISAKGKMRDWALHQLINLTPDEFVEDPGVVRLVEEGAAGDTIAKVALEVGADLTILGTHEYGIVHERLLGTTTGRLLNRSSTPILTVRL